MKQDLKCMIGSHKFEVYVEEDVRLFGTDIVVGKVITSRCTNCGKIKTEKVGLVTYHY